MGRPPSNGGPSFRFTQAEIAEMEAILQAHKIAMPERHVLVSLAEKFSKSEERSGKIEVQMKQVWNWFQNRRYAIRAKAAKEPGKLNVTQMARDDSSMVKSMPQATQPNAASLVNVRSLPQVPQQPTVPSASVRTFPQAPQQPPAFSVQSAGRVMDNSQMEYEAKSARDGAWYDVSTFISHRSLDTDDPEVFVRFAGFGAEEDEWVNVKKNVRQRSLPCEASECVAVLPADLILCFQEGKEQALYFDAHVLDAQRRRHDVRGCRCRFLVRYDHDQSEEIVALRKICRRPETDYRLQQLHAVNESIAANQNKNGANNNNNININTVSTLRVYPPAEVQPKQQKVEPETPQKRQRLDPTAPPAVEPEKVHVSSAHVDEVPVEMQKVQPLMPDPVTEEHNKAEPSAKPAELHDVKPDVSEETKSDEPKVAEVAMETKVDDSVVAEPNSAQEAVETKTEEHVVLVSSNDPSVVQEAKSEEPVVHVDSNVTQEAKTKEAAVLVDSNVAQEAKTEEPVVPFDPNVVQETKTEEPVAVVLVGSNVVQETKTEEPVGVVPVGSNVTQEAITEIDPYVTQWATTEELMMFVDSYVVQEERFEGSIDFNVAQEDKTGEPIQEAKTEEPVIEAEKEPKVSEVMEINEDKRANAAENVSDDKGENLDLAPKNDAVAMEEG